MLHLILLKRFDYSIPGSNTDGGSIDRELPLMKINIDFQKGKLSLDGNDLPEMIAARKPELMRSAFDKRSIRVKATIHPNYSADLANFVNNEMVFSLEGSINDGKGPSACSGILVLGSTTGRNKSWSLRIYLYDDCHDERMIKISLPVYSLSENATLN